MKAARTVPTGGWGDTVRLCVLSLPTKQEAYAFRLREHITRWFESMKMMRFSVPYSFEDLEEALLEPPDPAWVADFFEQRTEDHR